MFSIKNSIESSFRERGSRFLGFLFPAGSEAAFSNQLDTLKSRYPDATHHCYGWRINPAQPKEFSTDDGEPSGTAGLPILNQLKSFEVINAGIVVVRYYGGTKLGKPGLIEAYGLAAQQCLEMAQLVSIKAVKLFEIQYPYPKENTIQKLKNDFKLSVIESEYLEHICLQVACSLELVEAFTKNLEGIEHLDIAFNEIGESYI